MRHYIRLFAIIAFAAGAAACDEDLSSVTGPTPNLEPTFASIQANLFEAPDLAGRVACVNCHTNVGRNPAGNLNLLNAVAYDQLVNRAAGGRPSWSLVAPGNPNASYLVEKLVANPSAPITGLRMPRNTPPYLTDGQILVLKRWIEIGAPRN